MGLLEPGIKLSWFAKQVCEAVLQGEGSSDGHHHRLGAPVHSDEVWDASPEAALILVAHEDHILIRQSCTQNLLE